MGRTEDQLSDAGGYLCNRCPHRVGLTAFWECGSPTIWSRLHRLPHSGAPSDRGLATTCPDVPSWVPCCALVGHKGATPAIERACGCRDTHGPRAACAGIVDRSSVDRPRNHPGARRGG